jgi:hypothetical protein
MKGCLIFFTYIFWILPKLAKYNYGWSSLEQYHNLKKKKHSLGGGIIKIESWMCLKLIQVAWLEDVFKWFAH